MWYLEDETTPDAPAMPEGPPAVTEPTQPPADPATPSTDADPDITEEELETDTTSDEAEALDKEAEVKDAAKKLVLAHGCVPRALSAVLFDYPAVTASLVSEASTMLTYAHESAGDEHRGAFSKIRDYGHYLYGAYAQALKDTRSYISAIIVAVGGGIAGLFSAQAQELYSSARQIDVGELKLRSTMTTERVGPMVVAVVDRNPNQASSLLGKVSEGLRRAGKTKHLHAALAIVGAYVALGMYRYWTRDTPRALMTAIALPLPTDSNGYHEYIGRLMGVINKDTSIMTGIKSERVAMKDHVTDIDPTHLERDVRDYAAVLDQFPGIIDRLQAKQREAIQMDNVWSRKAYTALHDIVLFIIRRASHNAHHLAHTLQQGPKV